MADRLERQLARECEKRQRLELELKWPELAVDHESVTEAEPVQSEDAVIVDPIGFNWRSVPTEVLKGDRRHHAYDEKLRRSVKAIQEYNAGLDDGE